MFLMVKGFVNFHLFVCLFSIQQLTLSENSNELPVEEETPFIAGKFKTA
jgi:hypothetical protein